MRRRHPERCSVQAQRRSHKLRKPHKPSVLCVAVVSPADRGKYLLHLVPAARRRCALRLQLAAPEDPWREIGLHLGERPAVLDSERRRPESRRPHPPQPRLPARTLRSRPIASYATWATSKSPPAAPRSITLASCASSSTRSARPPSSPSSPSPAEPRPQPPSPGPPTPCPQTAATPSEAAAPPPPGREPSPPASKTPAISPVRSASRPPSSCRGRWGSRRASRVIPVWFRELGVLERGPSDRLPRFPPPFRGGEAAAASSGMASTMGLRSPRPSSAAVRAARR